VTCDCCDVLSSRCDLPTGSARSGSWRKPRGTVGLPLLPLLANLKRQGRRERLRTPSELSARFLQSESVTSSAGIATALPSGGKA
jgi:hypothetical protein